MLSWRVNSQPLTPEEARGSVNSRGVRLRGFAAGAATKPVTEFSTCGCRAGRARAPPVDGPYEIAKAIHDLRDLV
jgi:hypothetical protein